MVDPPRRIPAAVTGVGVALCVLGWYQISGQPTVPQQLPYLASATLPGAALLAAGVAGLLRGPLGRGPGASGRHPDAASGEYPSDAVREASPGGPPSSAATPASAPPSAPIPTRDLPADTLLRIPDGRYVHVAECPLLEARNDAVPVAGSDASVLAELRPCPLCRPAAHEPR